jgi:excisionase family DNA binding protein
MSPRRITQEDEVTIEQTPPQSPTFHDVREVAGILRMSRMTVYRAISTGEIAAVRIRGRWLVPAKVIAELVDKATSAIDTEGER